MVDAANAAPARAAHARRVATTTSASPMATTPCDKKSGPMVGMWRYPVDHR